MNWQSLVQQQPKLDSLLREIKAVKDDRRKKSFCANAVWYGYGQHRSLANSFKHRMSHLVGCYAHNPNPQIRSQKAYELAYQTLYEALPNCRNCSCF